MDLSFPGAETAAQSGEDIIPEAGSTFFHRTRLVHHFGPEFLSPLLSSATPRAEALPFPALRAKSREEGALGSHSQNTAPRWVLGAGLSAL